MHTLNYHSSLYQLPKETLLSLTTLKPWKSHFAVFQTWVALIALTLLGRYYRSTPNFWIFYFPLSFLIAGRIGALLQLIHEGSHGMLSHSKKLNHFIASWFCAFPVGIFFDGYTTGHRLHHAWTNTEKDPKADTEKYKVTDLKNPKLYFLFLKDLMGITALSIFFAYEEAEQKPKKRSLSHLVCISTLQLFIIGILFNFNLINYLLFWIFPAISSHMFLMRIRGIAEHGLSSQLGIKVLDARMGNFYTRSFLTDQNKYRFTPLIWLEKILIASLEVYHHHEHHLFPTVPFYNLKILHRLIGSEVNKNNPDVYAAGYFAAAIGNLRSEKTVKASTYA